MLFTHKLGEMALPPAPIVNEPEALIEPKIRKKTKPSRAAKERRIESKKRRGSTKRQRQGPGLD